MMNKKYWNALKRRQLAKKNGLTEFELYLRDLVCTAISKFTEEDLQAIDIMDKTIEFCNGDKQTLLRILGCVKGTLDLQVYLTDEQMEHLFEAFPTVYSIMEFFYVETGKRNKQVVPEIEYKGLEKKEEKTDVLESPYLF